MDARCQPPDPPDTGGCNSHVSTRTGAKTLRMIGLTRKSRGEDEGTHADQRKIIEDHIAREARRPPSAWRRSTRSPAARRSGAKREVGRAVEDVKAGKADGIIVAFGLTASRASGWPGGRNEGGDPSRCASSSSRANGSDSRRKEAELSFGIEALVARDKIEVTQKRSNLGRARVVAEGIHGGDTAPYGYRWTDRADGSKNLSGNAKHGPLDIDPETEPRAVQMVKAARRGARPEGTRPRPGLSDGEERDMLRNPVYTGVAYSGEYINNNGVGEGLLEQSCSRRIPRSSPRNCSARMQRRSPGSSRRRSSDATTRSSRACWPAERVAGRSSSTGASTRTGARSRLPKAGHDHGHRIEGFRLHERSPGTPS